MSWGCMCGRWVVMAPAVIGWLGVVVVSSEGVLCASGGMRSGCSGGARGGDGGGVPSGRSGFCRAFSVGGGVVRFLGSCDGAIPRVPLVVSPLRRSVLARRPEAR